MENIIINKTESIEYLQFKKLLEFQDVLTHAYTLKKYNVGMSKDAYDKRENLNKISSALGFDKKFFIGLNQAHTNNVIEIKNSLAIEEKADGLITNQSKKALLIGTADCICLMLYEPKNKVIANVHSGWRGTSKRIVQETIKKMVSDYDCKTQNIICCIGPALRKDHFLVNDDVVDIFKNEFPKYCNEAIEKTEFYNKKGMQYKIDTVYINKMMLKELGVLDKNIIDSNLCTMCEKDMFYSYRTSKENLKNNIGVIMLK